MTAGPCAPGRLTWRRILGGGFKPAVGWLVLSAPVALASVLPLPTGAELEAGAAATQGPPPGMMGLTAPLLIVLIAVFLISVVRRFQGL